MKKDLIKRAKNKDEEAFRMLVEEYQNMVVNLAYSLSGDIHEAEDIAQEVFVKIYNKLGSFREEAKFSTWLYRITVNTVHDFSRRKRRNIPLDSLPPLKEVNDFRENLHKTEVKEIVESALRQLPIKYREVVVLRDIEGCDYREISRVLGCRIGTVESRLFRARNMLKKMLKPLLTKESVV